MREVGDIHPQGEGRCSPPGAIVAALAERQHGVVARRQLRARGFSDKTIDSWVRRRWLHPVHAGVYAVGHGKLRGDARLMAAVLACGPGAVLSHRSAAQAWGLRRSSSRRVEVTVPRSRRGRPGITTYRARNLHPDDVAMHDGFPVTSVARTILDLASVTDEREVGRAVEHAERLGLFDLVEVEAACGRGRGKRGVRVVRRALTGWRDPTFTRSELERAFAALCEQHEIPLPSFNVNLLGHEVDALWEEDRVVVELDGYEWHRTRAAFERDRRRDAELARAGYRVLRFTWRQVRYDAATLAAAIVQSRPAPPVKRIAPTRAGGQTTPLANRRP